MILEKEIKQTCFIEKRNKQIYLLKRKLCKFILLKNYSFSIKSKYILLKKAIKQTYFTEKSNYANLSYWKSKLTKPNLLKEEIR